MPRRRRLHLPGVVGGGGRSPGPWITWRRGPRTLEARLEQLQGMITDLASNERYEDVLQGIVASTMEAVWAAAPCWPSSPGPPSPGRSTPRASPRQRPPRSPSRCWPGAPTIDRPCPPRSRPAGATTASWPSASTAVCSPPRRRTPSTPMPDWPPPRSTPPTPSKRPGTGPHGPGRCWGLSTSLAEIVSPEEMATKVVRAVPEVIDCDRASLLLDHGDWPTPLPGVPADGLLRLLRRGRRAGSRAAVFTPRSWECSAIRSGRAHLRPNWTTHRVGAAPSPRRHHHRLHRGQRGLRPRAAEDTSRRPSA